MSSLIFLGNGNQLYVVHEPNEIYPSQRQDRNPNMSTTASPVHNPCGRVSPV